MAETERELAFLGKVYDLFLTHPVKSAFRESELGPEDEPHTVDQEMLTAIYADRFDLMSAIRKMRENLQLELLSCGCGDPTRAGWTHRPGWCNETDEARAARLGSNPACPQAPNCPCFDKEGAQVSPCFKAPGDRA